MIDDLGRAMGDAVRAFRTEVGRREPEDAVAELLAGMRAEMVARKQVLLAEREVLERAREALAAEEKALGDCERRGAMARRIDDRETARVADAFARRHALEVERLKERVLENELDVQAAEEESAVLKHAYRSADAERHALVAVLRREGWHGAIDEEGGAFALYRKIRERARDAGEEREARADARLAELKRRAAEG